MVSPETLLMLADILNEIKETPTEEWEQIALDIESQGYDSHEEIVYDVIREKVAEVLGL